MRPQFTRTNKHFSAFIAGLKNIHVRALLTLISFVFLASSQNVSMLSAQGQQRERVRVTTVTDPKPKFRNDRVIVRFKGEAKARVVSTNDPKGAIARYRNDASVLYAEPDYIVNIDTTVPTDSLWPQQWDMAKISAPQAWDTQRDASDVIVAIIDTGIDYTHPDLQANLWSGSNGSHGFTCLNGSCVAGGQDDYGHGTHVAGTIGAAANNGQGMAGINWRTQLLSCKFLDANGSGSVSDAILCFNQILSLKQQGYNIRVINNSWGGDGYSQGLKDAMLAVEAAGIVNVCAAGNSGVNADLTPMYPGGFDNRGIVSVLATDSNDVGAYFTNYGVANVDIAAPGVNAYSTVPTGTCPMCDPSGYRPASGTSMATPHVTGVLAAMFHRNPALSAAEARDVLLDPSSYDSLTEARGSMTSTGGRLNFAKAIGTPRLMSPVLNRFPVLSPVANVVANTGETITMSASASDPDGDPLRMVWQNSSFDSYTLMGYMLNRSFPTPSGSSFSFVAPAFARTATMPYAVSVSDGKGGSAAAVAYATILPTSNAGAPPSGNLSVSPASGPVGTTVTVNFPVTDPDGGSSAWDFWFTGLGGGSGVCCQTGTSYSFPINSAGVFRITAQAIDNLLNFSNRQTTVVRIGGATGTPPIANAVFNTLSGPAPLTVNVDMTGSTDPDGTVQSYTTTCQYGTSGYSYMGVKTTCVYDKPGTYQILLQVKDNTGLMDILSTYAVVTPPNSGTTEKTPATVTLSNMMQTYTGSALAPTATTNPPGLAVTWTNAPQTQVGSYSVTATVNDPNYQGSATGTFVINANTTKSTATVTLNYLNQTYTGGPLQPTVTTNPPGLAIVWTNAPQTKTGSYAVTATVNDPDYQGSTSGTFVINKANASVTLSNMTQTYTGSPLTPAATTNPPGLAIGWTNAPQTNAGSYNATASVNDPNYQGATSGVFTIAPSTPSTPPVASITSPTGGTVPSGTLTIKASVVQGTNPVARVDFVVNGTVKCSDTGLPYICAWNVPSARNKSYQVQVKAYDTAGQVGLSPVVTVTH